MGGLTRTVDATETPVSVADCKRHARIFHNDDDDLIESHLEVAVEALEEATWRQFCTATWAWTLDCFPGGVDADGFSLSWSGEPLRVPKPPLASVTSIGYVDTAGDAQTWSASEYQVSAARQLIQPAYGYTYPSTRQQLDAVTVTFVAGQAASAVPKRIKHAVMMLVVELYDFRSPLTVGSVMAVKGFQRLVDSISRRTLEPAG